MTMPDSIQNRDDPAPHAEVRVSHDRASAPGAGGEADRGDGEFRPVFIVGAPRSGTTLLAALLDRHPNISVPRESKFYWMFLPRMQYDRSEEGRPKMVEALLSFHTFAEYGLDRRDVLARFLRYKNTPDNLFRSILEAYASKMGKKRPGEKTPRHLLHVPHLLASFPSARVICIIRDGRDAVLSMQRMPWAFVGAPRRFGSFCADWVHYAHEALSHRRSFPSSFLTLRYENLLQRPEHELTRICAFIGERFEPQQLDPRIRTDAPPRGAARWWHAKAKTAVDPSRVEAWRREATREQIWFMNSRMGPMLRRLGYTDTGLEGCPWPRACYLKARRIPHMRYLHPLTVFTMERLRSLWRMLFSGGASSSQRDG